MKYWRCKETRWRRPGRDLILYLYKYVRQKAANSEGRNANQPHGFQRGDYVLSRLNAVDLENGQTDRAISPTGPRGFRSWKWRFKDTRRRFPRNRKFPDHLNYGSDNGQFERAKLPPGSNPLIANEVVVA